jgi:uncharacterized protein YaiE (UPF0345 family)
MDMKGKHKFTFSKEKCEDMNFVYGFCNAEAPAAVEYQRDSRDEEFPTGLHFVLSISSSEEEGCLPVCQRQPNCL